MKTTKRHLCLFLLPFFALSIALGAPSKPKPAAEKEDAKLLARGTEKLFDLEYAAAEKDFRKALAVNEKNAAIHNNLAFVLRKQGTAHFEEALQHYNRALKLNAELAEAYMYRGVLYTSMGQPDLALQDHARLLELDKSKLADELEWVIKNGKEKEPARFFGVVKN
ncbi:MAG: tetratricopeptide repeat protein [Verrucomicrobia bacterium]|jgi:Tfp pilus assembly protein PilF|nr:tetratricopeptide repeat protein [Verrucomicrobiota bacterium]